MKPLLLLDVDGPLNPYGLITRRGHLLPKVRRGEAQLAYDKHLLRPAGWETGDPLPVLVSPEMGELLDGLRDVFTLVWATTWEDDANTMIAPLLGLPELRVIRWPARAREWTLRPPMHRGSWKTPHILRWIGNFAVCPNGRHVPWVWVDDDIGPDDRKLVCNHYGEKHGETPGVARWLIHVEPAHGLRRRDFDDLRAWAEETSIS